MKTALVPAVRNLLKQAPEQLLKDQHNTKKFHLIIKKRQYKMQTFLFTKFRYIFFFSLFNQVQITLPTTSCSSITLLEMVSHGLLQKADINILQKKKKP